MNSMNNECTIQSVITADGRTHPCTIRTTSMPGIGIYVTSSFNDRMTKEVLLTTATAMTSSGFHLQARKFHLDITCPTVNPHSLCRENTSRLILPIALSFLGAQTDLPEGMAASGGLLLDGTAEDAQVQCGKIFLKPKTLKEAVQELQALAPSCQR